MSGSSITSCKNKREDVYAHYVRMFVPNCSQKIGHHYFLENIKTKHIIPVGSDCIEKFGSDRDRELMHIKERRRTYTGEKVMCHFCCENRVAIERSVPLCNKCLDAGRTRPSREYLDAFGVPCVVCQEERIAPGLITCCQSCKLFSCNTCSVPLHSTTEGMYNGGWYHLCSYCDDDCREVGTYCMTCNVPLTSKQKKYGNIECSKCHFGWEKKMNESAKKNRSCSECSIALPVEQPSHWKKCKSCQFVRTETPTKSHVIKFCSKCKQDNKKFYSPENWCKVCLDCHKGR